MTLARIRPNDNDLVISLIKPINGETTAPPTIAVQMIPATVPSWRLSNELTVSEKMHGNIIDVKNPTDIKAMADI